MVIPSSATSTSLSSLISQGKWGDDDGDGQGAGGVTASGNISLAIKDRNGTTVNRSDTLSLCNAPYKVTLDSTGGTLETRYGMPKTSRFYGGTVDYYITLPSQPVICSVRPNLLYGGTTGINSLDNPRFAGPANIWNPAKGFLVQSTSPSSYNLNFPTTGADGLYFDLDIGGIDGGQLTWSPVTHSGITATVRWTRPLIRIFTSPIGDSVIADEWITDKSKNVTRVTLTGPRASSSQISSSSPGPLPPPSLPQRFELVGRDSSGNAVVKYGFVLRQWFVHRGNQRKLYGDQLAWCNSLGYRMPRVRDFTNAKCGVDNYWFPCVNGIDGAAPRASDNNYMRHIGAGFLTEWGHMHYYADAGFVRHGYWTSDSTGSNHFDIGSDNGDVRIVPSASDTLYGLCTAP